MISKILYDLCSLLSTPYDNLHLISENTHFIDNLLLEKIYLDKLLIFKRRKSLNSIFKNIRFNYNYTQLEQYYDLLKLQLNLSIYFKVKGAPNNILSCRTYEYIIILEHLQDKFKVQFLIENEENPILYNKLLNTHLSLINNLDVYSDKILFDANPSLPSKLPKTLIHLEETLYNNSKYRNKSNFNVLNACTYAETYALNSNPQYKSFDGIGGDCTNFVSQILYAGGIGKTKTWTPYTNAWIRVEDLYSYLISENLAVKLPNDNSLNKGDLIQFYTPVIGRFFHNGFITYKLPNNDCLYCCHSYNKLNYPLSEIYPHRYPKLRALKLN